MIFILSTLINLLLIFAVWRLSRPKPLSKYNIRPVPTIRYEQEMKEYEDLIYKTFDSLEGRFTKMYISAKIAEKTADRAFNLASSANLGVIALQKALVVPRLMTKTQATQNQLAKKTIDELFSGNDDILDYLRPVATDEELDVIDKIQDDKRRAEMNGEHKA